MRRDSSSDYETASLFVILGILTLIFVWGAHWLLFAPSKNGETNYQNAETGAGIAAPVKSSRP